MSPKVGPPPAHHASVQEPPATKATDLPKACEQIKLPEGYAIQKVTKEKDGNIKFEIKTPDGTNKTIKIPKSEIKEGKRADGGAYNLGEIKGKLMAGLLLPENPTFPITWSDANSSAGLPENTVYLSNNPKVREQPYRMILVGQNIGIGATFDEAKAFLHTAASPTPSPIAPAQPKQPSLVTGLEVPKPNKNKTTTVAARPQIVTVPQNAETGFDKLATATEGIRRSENAAPGALGVVTAVDTRVSFTKADGTAIQINANRIGGPPATHIAMGAPNTAEGAHTPNVLRALIHEGSNTIVNLRQPTETKYSSACWHPTTVGEQTTLKDGQTTIQCTSAIPLGDPKLGTKYVLDVNIDGKSKKITVYNFEKWVDKEAPPEGRQLEKFRQIVRKDQEIKGPLVVHCAGGVGRTGTFILQDQMHTAAARGKTWTRDDLHTAIIKLREERAKNPGQEMVQTETQLASLYAELDSLHATTAAELAKAIQLPEGYVIQKATKEKDGNIKFEIKTPEGTTKTIKIPKSEIKEGKRAHGGTYNIGEIKGKLMLGLLLPEGFVNKQSNSEEPVFKWSDAKTSDGLPPGTIYNAKGYCLKGAGTNAQLLGKTIAQANDHLAKTPSGSTQQNIEIYKLFLRPDDQLAQASLAVNTSSQDAMLSETVKALQTFIINNQALGLTWSDAQSCEALTIHNTVYYDKTAKEFRVVLNENQNRRPTTESLTDTLLKSQAALENAACAITFGTMWSPLTASHQVRNGMARDKMASGGAVYRSEKDNQFYYLASQSANPKPLGSDRDKAAATLASIKKSELENLAVPKKVHFAHTDRVTTFTYEKEKPIYVQVELHAGRMTDAQELAFKLVTTPLDEIQRLLRKTADETPLTQAEIQSLKTALAETEKALMEQVKGLTPTPQSTDDAEIVARLASVAIEARNYIQKHISEDIPPHIHLKMIDHHASMIVDNADTEGQRANIYTQVQAPRGYTQWCKTHGLSPIEPIE